MIPPSTVIVKDRKFAETDKGFGDTMAGTQTASDMNAGGGRFIDANKAKFGDDLAEGNVR